MYVHASSDGGVGDQTVEVVYRYASLCVRRWRSREVHRYASDGGGRVEGEAANWRQYGVRGVEGADGGSKQIWCKSSISRTRWPLSVSFTKMFVGSFIHHY